MHGGATALSHFRRSRFPFAHSIVPFNVMLLCLVQSIKGKKKIHMVRLIQPVDAVKKSAGAVARLRGHHVEAVYRCSSYPIIECIWDV